jgi:hypothetical protein
LGTLTVSNQMTREQAISRIKGIPYPSERSLEDDKLYFAKKWVWTLQQLQEYINKSDKNHMNYPSEIFLWDWFAKIYNL